MDIGCDGDNGEDMYSDPAQIRGTVLGVSGIGEISSIGMEMDGGIDDMNMDGWIDDMNVDGGIFVMNLDGGIDVMNLDGGIGGMDVDGQDTRDCRECNGLSSDSEEQRVKPCDGDVNGDLNEEETQYSEAENNGISSSVERESGISEPADDNATNKENGYRVIWHRRAKRSYVDTSNQQQEAPKRLKTRNYTETIEEPRLTRWARLEEDIFVSHIMHSFKHKLILVQVDTQICNLDMSSKSRSKLQMQRKIQAWGPQGETLQFVPACHVRVAFEMV